MMKMKILQRNWAGSFLDSGKSFYRFIMEEEESRLCRSMPINEELALASKLLLNI
jgi:hypothetical protein